MSYEKLPKTFDELASEFTLADLLSQVERKCSERVDELQKVIDNTPLELRKDLLREVIMEPLRYRRLLSDIQSAKQTAVLVD